MTMNYNTDLILWQNFKQSRESMPNGGTILTVIDGHIHDGMQYLGRFDNDKHANDTLRDAGFTPKGDNKWK